MEDKNSKQEQDEQLREMNYDSSEDIFEQQKEVAMDENGNVIEEGNLRDQNFYDGMEMDLDVPGSDLDDKQEGIGSEDEENNYWSFSDQDDHEEENEDLIN